MTKSIELTEQAINILTRLAQKTDKSHQELIEVALDAYERELFWEGVNKAYEELRNDPVAWQEELEERALWDATLADGLEDE